MLVEPQFLLATSPAMAMLLPSDAMPHQAPLGGGRLQTRTQYPGGPWRFQKIGSPRTGQTSYPSSAQFPQTCFHVGLEKVAETTSELKAATKGHILPTVKNASASLSVPSTASADSLSRHPAVSSTDTFLLVTSLSSQASAKEPAPKTSKEKQGSKSGGEMKDKGGAKPKMNSTLKDGRNKMQWAGEETGSGSLNNLRYLLTFRLQCLKNRSSYSSTSVSS
ncbi:UNVERIFIED_CONTAM: hypothetical protein H355_016680 [Colinus virginianus]|nr:hypothetical protein H355_016680 [Colinus virginianus]